VSSIETTALPSVEFDAANGGVEYRDHDKAACAQLAFPATGPTLGLSLPSGVAEDGALGDFDGAQSPA